MKTLEELRRLSLTHPNGIERYILEGRMPIIFPGGSGDLETNREYTVVLPPEGTEFGDAVYNNLHNGGGLEFFHEDKSLGLGKMIIVTEDEAMNLKLRRHKTKEQIGLKDLPFYESLTPEEYEELKQD